MTSAYAGIAAWKFKLKAEIRSYEQAIEFLRSHGIASAGFGGVELGPQMTIYPHGHPIDGERGYIAIELYSTEIIRYYPDGSFSVDSGGFNTPTTRERLQAVVPDGWRVYVHTTKWLGTGIGLMRFSEPRVPGAQYRKAQPKGALWPLTHADRIDITTATRKEIS